MARRRGARDTPALENETRERPRPIWSSDVGRVTNADMLKLVGELERMKNTSKDIVADTRDLVAVAENDTVQLAVGGEAFPLNRHAHQQLAEKTGIPFGYYERMGEAHQNDLLAENINRWLQKEPERRLIRVAAGQVRAVLSDRYRVLDNWDLAFRVAEAAKNNGAQFLRCDLTETRMNLQLIVPGAQEKIGELTAAQKAAQFRGTDTHSTRPQLDADYVVPGLMVSNSEVGDGAFRVEPFVHRLICWNGVVGTETLSRIHVGARMELGEVVYTDETRRLSDAALWSQVSDVISATFKREILRAWVQKLQHTQETVIKAPVKVIDVVARDLSLPEARRDALLGYFSTEGASGFGLVNGITRLAQDFAEPDDMVRVQRYAGGLLDGSKLAEFAKVEA